MASPVLWVTRQVRATRAGICATSGGVAMPTGAMRMAAPLVVPRRPVSSGGAPASDLFGVIPWPNLPLADESLSETLGSAHTLSVKAIYVVLALHVLGALKHHFFDKDTILVRMLRPIRNGK